MTDQNSPQHARREWEDTLLHARTGVFLVMNGFAVQKPTVLLAAAMAAINSLWILASFQSWAVIRSLVQAYQESGAQSDVDTALGSKRIHRVFRPTTLMALWIPSFVHFAWLSYIGNVTASCGMWIAVSAAALLPFAILFLLHLRK